MSDEAMTREEAELNSAQILKDFQQQHDLGDTLALIQAVRLCVAWGIPIPGWARETALAAVEEFYERNRGAPNKGMTGGLMKQRERYAKNQERIRVAEHEIARGKHGLDQKGKDAALERASERLRSTPARASAKTIDNVRSKHAARIKSAKQKKPDN